MSEYGRYGIYQSLRVMNVDQLTTVLTSEDQMKIWASLPLTPSQRVQLFREVAELDDISLANESPISLERSVSLSPVQEPVIQNSKVEHPESKQ